MALDMTPEQKAIGKANFQRAVGKLAEDPPRTAMGFTRRKFMKGLVAAGAALPVAAAAYFGYNKSAFGNEPIKAALIGAGDEGGVLVGEHNPAYVKFVAYSDIRPYNQKRIFENEKGSNPRSTRLGFKFHYGNQCDRPGSADHVQLYTDYRQMLRRDDIKMVVIALPLNLHYVAVMDALEAGKHVLCEKLMAWNIRQCKEMILRAKEKDLLLAVGHQRHYSMLYAHAVEALETGILGDVRHIRALWHRNQVRPLPERDAHDPTRIYADSWRPPLRPQDREKLTDADVRNLKLPGPDGKAYGYDSLNQLVRWRLYRKTGGGLMAELGSHQLDACSIFLGKKRPIAVTGNGGKHFYTDDREIEDHVYCMFEFPGKHYNKDERRQHDDAGNFLHNDIVMVNYSSINTNSYEPYGECVMGSKGTLVVEEEKTAMLYGTGGRSTAVTVSSTGGRPAVDSSGSTDAPREVNAMGLGAAALGNEISRGYREEMEHFAYCVRMRGEGTSRDRAETFKPRCDGKAAMADAIMALAANQAIRVRGRVEFKSEWFEKENPNEPGSVPEWDPKMD